MYRSKRWFKPGGASFAKFGPLKSRDDPDDNDDPVENETQTPLEGKYTFNTTMITVSIGGTIDYIYTYPKCIYNLWWNGGRYLLYN